MGIRVSNNRGIIFLHFVVSNKIFSREDYTRSKRHVNHYVTFEHERYKYGVIVGLFVIKPEYSCTIAELQYCNCSSNDVVIIRPMVVTSRPLTKVHKKSLQLEFTVNTTRVWNMLNTPTKFYTVWFTQCVSMQSLKNRLSAIFAHFISHD